MSLLLQCLIAIIMSSHSQHILSAGVEIPVVALDWCLQTFLDCTSPSLKNF